MYRNMRIFKWIDCGVQAGIIFFSLILLFVNTGLGLLLFFLGTLAWDLLSVATNFALGLPKKLLNRRMHLLVHVAALILGFFLLFVAPPVWVYAYAFYAVGLALYYLRLTYLELRFLEELHSQITLVDVQHH